jgi:hypothetical protein
MNRLLMLIAGHALCDYPLQGDFLAKAKNRTAPIPGVPWYQALGAHAAIHGGMVALVTGSTAMGIAETTIHALTDDMKCRGKLSYNQDQVIHLACKVLWAALSTRLASQEQSA